MKPIGKYIVIQNIDEEIKTESGLILSGEDAKQLRYRHGVVVKAGTDVKNIDEGDEIYYDKNTSFTMMINDQQYTVIREIDVVVVL
jgi:co-chaperonin GroES (HSP10)